MSDVLSGLPDHDPGELPPGFVDPIANPELPAIVEATEDDWAAAFPPAERLNDEPEHVQARPQRGMALAACAIPGINLRDYSKTPQGRGFGSPCSIRLATITLAEARLSVDVRLSELAWLIMAANEAQGYRYRKADTGAYNCRKIAGTTSWSWHAWAGAIDGNWQTNPYVSPLRTDRPQWERDRWNRYGWAGGWDYSGRKDAMHTEWMGTVAQIAPALELARRELLPIINGTPAPAPGGIVYEDRVEAKPGDRVLSVGKVGPDVEFVQRWHGIDDDGFYGPGTKGKVEETQRRNGLDVDGVVGPATWRVLGVGGPPPIPRPPVLSWVVPAGHWLGNVAGGEKQHGGDPRYDSPAIRDLVGNVQEWLIYRGCVPGQDDWRNNGWVDKRWEAATDKAMVLWHDRFYPGQPEPAQCWIDDYRRLTA